MKINKNKISVYSKNNRNHNNSNDNSNNNHNSNNNYNNNITNKNNKTNNNYQNNKDSDTVYVILGWIYPKAVKDSFYPHPKHHMVNLIKLIGILYFAGIKDMQCQSGQKYIRMPRSGVYTRVSFFCYRSITNLRCSQFI